MKKLGFIILFSSAISIFLILPTKASAATTYAHILNYTFDKETSTKKYYFERVDKLKVDVFYDDTENFMSYKNTIDLSDFQVTYSNYLLSEVRDFIIFTTYDSSIIVQPLFNKAYDTSTGITYYLEDLIDIDTLTITNIGVRSSKYYDFSPTFNAKIKNTDLSDLAAKMLNATYSPKELNYYDFRRGRYVYRYKFSKTSNMGTLTQSDSYQYGNNYYFSLYIPSSEELNIPYQIVSTLDIHNITDNIDSTYTVGVVPDLFKTYDRYLPEYLDGYKEVNLDTNTKFAYLSGLKKGRIYVPFVDFADYGGKLFYMDIEKDYMPGDAYILGYGITDDGKYAYQDFDLTNYEGADLVTFAKFVYLEYIDYDDFSYSIYVPNDMYVSKTKPVVNEQGNVEFPYEYVDENGDVQSNVNTSIVTYDDDNTFFGIIKNSLSTFTTNVNYICSIFTDFYNGLPDLVKSCIMLVFGISVLMVLVSFIF